MKKLLVPTDFSDSSTRALDAAVILANLFLAEITVFHAFRRGRSGEMNEYLESNAEEEMEKLLYAYRPRLEEGASLTGSTVIREPVEAISRHAEQEQYDLIIMSTQGEGGIKGFLMGSTTLEVVRKTKRPLLAIPSEASLKGMEHFVLAIDEKGIMQSDTLSLFRELAKTLDATVSIYHQTENQRYQVPNLIVDAAMEGIEHNFHQEVSEAEVWEGILKYVEQQEADLLCLIRRERGFFQELFHHSVTREELSACSIPMLLLHERN